MQSRKIGVLLGGLSSEREVSLRTGEAVLMAARITKRHKAVLSGRGRDLGRFDAIVVGPRAYEVDSALVRHSARLVEFARGGGLVLVGNGGSVLRSTDDGQSFSVFNRPDRIALSGVSGQADGQLILVGQGGARLATATGAARAQP